MKIITEMTTAEMVAEYNQLTGKSIKKFSDRKAGERQLTAARNIEETKNIFKGVPPVSAPKKEKKIAPPVKEKSEGNFKMRITVNGKPYRSVAVAFEELGMPMSKHIKFRALLKTSDKETFEHEGKKYNFINLQPKS